MRWNAVVDESAQLCVYLLLSANVCVFSRACFTAVCLSTLWSQTLDRSCEVSITSQSNGGLVLLHFTSREVLIGPFLGKRAKNGPTKADKCNRRQKDYQSNGVKPALGVTDVQTSLICVSATCDSVTVTILQSHKSPFFPTETHTCHSRTTGYQSKCITMNILGIIVLEFADTQVVSKRNVLLC